MGHSASGDHHIYVFYYGQENHKTNGVAIIINKALTNSMLGYNPKTDRMTSIQLQGKPINVIVIRVYAPIINGDETEIEDFYFKLQQSIDATPQRDTGFIMDHWNAKARSELTAGITGNIGFELRNELGDKLVEFCQNNPLPIANTFFNSLSDYSTNGDRWMVNIDIK